jgi:predicted nucleic acid-binding protein
VIVIDANVALGWILEETENPQSAAALEYVMQHGALVPGNFQSEVVHALLNALRRGILTQPDVSSALAELFALSITPDFPDPHVIIAVGQKHGLTGYDAAYLALALQAQLPLATIDKTLQKAARSEGFAWNVR